ncbi:hypothetical protein NBRC111894_1145 [Sporolactobacillus inulinus]|uniref:Uncharacterized protein n=1 Tax=Sporolactobacillus inulinus TaxID=2078 RepID=A0A4Y1Z9L2_9BACL|nr:hypothetical protein [Sporolactobacillus inulinus]GAY75591.1 hypothetical protein NBRC111894_1145 [Sporolactobacillus inulinus]
MKRIAEMMNVPIIMFPDQSGVMDAPMTGRYEIFLRAGQQLMKSNHLVTVKI